MIFLPIIVYHKTLDITKTPCRCQAERAKQEFFNNSNDVSLVTVEVGAPSSGGVLVMDERRSGMRGILSCCELSALSNEVKFSMLFIPNPSD